MVYLFFVEGGIFLRMVSKVAILYFLRAFLKVFLYFLSL